LTEKLPPLPDRIARLPLDPLRNLPVPWFVAWLRDGKECTPGFPGALPDFRIIGHNRIAHAHHGHVCWMCGEAMGSFCAFPLGPMCTVSRTVSEPPCHRECAEFALCACPFLLNPKRGRRPFDFDVVPAAGVPIARNPGAYALWVTKSYKPFHVSGGNGGVLFEVGEPTEVVWYQEGRKATRAEVLESLESGLPSLRDLCPDADGMAELDRAVACAMKFVPKDRSP
jgi:hypothetical protein